MYFTAGFSQAESVEEVSGEIASRSDGMLANASDSLNNHTGSEDVSPSESQDKAELPITVGITKQGTTCVW